MKQHNERSTCNVFTCILTEPRYDKPLICIHIPQTQPIFLIYLKALNILSISKAKNCTSTPSLYFKFGRTDTFFWFQTLVHSTEAKFVTILPIEQNSPHFLLSHSQIEIDFLLKNQVTRELSLSKSVFLFYQYTCCALSCVHEYRF